MRGEEAHGHAAEAAPAKVACPPGVLVHLPREVVVEDHLREADEAAPLGEAHVAAQRIGTGGHEQGHLAAREVFEGARALRGAALGVQHRAAQPPRQRTADGVTLALGEAEDDEAATRAEGVDLPLEEKRLCRVVRYVLWYSQWVSEEGAYLPLRSGR